MTYGQSLTGPRARSVQGDYRITTADPGRALAFQVEVSQRQDLKAVMEEGQGCACNNRTMVLRYTFTAVLWLYPGEAGWHFLSLPDPVAAEVREDTATLRRGFGSVKITATIAGHRWSTSLFPDTQSGSYLLPVKKAIRTTAGIEAGDQVMVHLEVPESG